jgi:hypothetical protein
VIKNLKSEGERENDSTKPEKDSGNAGSAKRENASSRMAFVSQPVEF